MSADAAPSEEEELLAQLREAVTSSGGRLREIEVGIPLSIALGRRRPSVSCGGCKNPLDFEGIPARTNARLREPFRLIFDSPSES
jgi:hypothetical protein